MIINTIDAKMLQKMFFGAANNIEAKKEYINELNVFPVPDGDTGTNMTMTIQSAAREVMNIEEPTMENLAKAISSGSLRGARGNSGVILSQLFRGFAKEIKSAKVLNVEIITKAFIKAVETAYKAVMKPKEGTILTVAKAGAERAMELVHETKDLVHFGKEVIANMEEVLARTPEMLPVLKEAGVVDSGGEGLLIIIKGAYEAFLGKEINLSIEKKIISTSKMENIGKPVDIHFGYCTEFIIMVEKKYTTKTESDFKEFLNSIGDSIVVVSDDGVVKVHVHTNDPGLAIQKALEYGSLTSMKIDNMREEHNERLIKDAQKVSEQQKKEDKKSEKPRKEVGFISVSIGEGMNEIFKGLGVDYLIEGGQTMNPSTEDVLNAIDQVNADTVFVLPNNKNIILAAEQAKTLTKDKNIIVVPSKTIPQGITAIINFLQDKLPEENLKRMIEEMEQVKSGQVTYAVRDTNIEGKAIKQGDIMGIGDSQIYSVGQDVEKVTLELISRLVTQNSELISIYYGYEVTEQTAELLNKRLEQLYPNIDIEFHMGGQPIYYYILSVE